MTYQLAFRPQMKVIEVAFAAGFTTPETFGRTFKRLFGQNPSEFRAAPRWTKYNFRLVVRKETMSAQDVLKQLRAGRGDGTYDRRLTRMMPS